MKLDEKGIAVRNPQATHLFEVEMHRGRSRWKVEIPADNKHEAMIVASNESAHGLSTGNVRQIS